MRRLVAYWVFTCERCNCKESVEGERHTKSERFFMSPALPKSWELFNECHYCAKCIRLIREVLAKC